MKTRDQLYSREAFSLLRDITTYHHIRYGQLLRLYPNKKEKIDNLLAYLVRQRRIFYDLERDIYHDGNDIPLDPGMLASLWILADFIDRIDFHSAADFPSKLIFVTESDVYETVYVAAGQEALIEHALSETAEESGKRIVIVEDVSQIPMLHISDAIAFCTIAPDGAIQYYKQE